MDDSKYEMPIGFSLKLGTNQTALNYFSTLDLDTKLKIKNYIQDNSSDKNSLRKTNDVISSLSECNLDFLP